jgi:hypothetical protein
LYESNGGGRLSVLPGVDGTLVPEAEAKESEEANATRQQDERVHQYANEKLKSLVKSDEMYYALENFLLRDPERQITQLGGSDRLLSSAESYRTKSENKYAKQDYEMVAKIEIYRGKKDKARRSLLLAQEVTPTDDEDHKLMTVLVDNMDEAIRIARSYYQVVDSDANTQNSVSPLSG